MAFKGWEKVFITTTEGQVESIAPLIISASRSTDIPAFHTSWFMNRLNAGYVKWINPFNQRTQYVSLNKARVIVFWTKNARPIIKFLPEIAARGLNFYFTYTVNDYEKEGLEPGVPALSERINTFIELANQIGKEKVIWRFDPLLLTDNVTVDNLLDKLFKVGEQLHRYTNKLVISFADIEEYDKVVRNLRNSHVIYRPLTQENKLLLAKEISNMAKMWGIEVATCAENINLSCYGIKRNKCIDDQLMVKLFSGDVQLMQFLGYSGENLFGEASLPEYNLKDKGQRLECGCIMSKDIGQYNTCLHLCKYCYANASPNVVKKNLHQADIYRESIVMKT